MNQTKRNEQYITQLTDFIRQKYNLTAVSITPAKRGFYGETWRLITADRSYFLKLVYFSEHQSVYERSFPITEHLCNHGIDFISRIVKTANGKLSTNFDGAVLGVFEWIGGENVETNETKIPEYNMLAKVYSVPVGDIQIPCEDFSGISANNFFELWKALDDKQIISLLEKHRAKLEYRAERLKHFAKVCQGDTTGFVIRTATQAGILS
jgi:hypothetical protein